MAPRLKVQPIVETHPSDYEGYPFMTLLQLKKTNDGIIGVVDNWDNNSIKIYVLDLCELSELNEEHLLEAAYQWFTTSLHIPFSIYLSQNDIHIIASKIYRVFPIDQIARVIGPCPKYDMATVGDIKRRRRRPIPPCALP